MSTPILATKLFIPPPRPNVVRRPRLIARLNAGLHRHLTLIAAPAGFGKTTLVSVWLQSIERRAQSVEQLHDAPALRSTFYARRSAWLSLDEGENDLTRFLTYLVAAVQTIAPHLGAGVLGALQTPQPPPSDTILTALLNEIATLPAPVVLVLDDCHLIDAPAVDTALTFLLAHLPPQLHLVIATRADPALPLARLRARGQVTELRAADLRFTPAEAAAFLTQVMGLTLAAADIAALERRTEGWIAGLQLAALSLQGQPDPPSVIRSFSGRHPFVLDYLLEEVLHGQAARVQTFLLRTSILDRLCGALCDAVLDDGRRTKDGLLSSVVGRPSSVVLAELEHANLFIVPLDNERRWYRYHQLFADLLRQRLHQRRAAARGDAVGEVAELHRRASGWYEAQGLELEAFQHAAAATFKVLLKNLVTLRIRVAKVVAFIHQHEIAIFIFDIAQQPVGAIFIVAQHAHREHMRVQLIDFVIALPHAQQRFWADNQRASALDSFEMLDNRCADVAFTKAHHIRYEAAEECISKAQRLDQYFQQCYLTRDDRLCASVECIP